MSLIQKPLRLTLPEEEIQVEYANGASLSHLARKYGCSASTIRSHLVKAGHEIRKQKGGRPKKKPVVDHEEIAAKIEADREVTEKQNKILEKPKRKIGW